MTVIVSASSPAPVATPAVTPVHASGTEGHGFSAALDALIAGEGKAKSTDEGDKRTSDEAADTASARPSADLRAALMGGALASLSMPPKAAPDTASPASCAHATASSSQSDSGSDAPAPAVGEAVSAAVGAKSVLKATVTAERAYIAPAAFAKALDGPGNEAPLRSAQAAGPQPTISTSGATAPGRPGAETVSTPSNAAAVEPLADATSAAETDRFATGPAAGLRPFVASAALTGAASSQDQVATASGASTVPPQPAGGTALPRSTRPFPHAATTTHAVGASSAARSPSAESTVETKTDESGAAKHGAAGEQAFTAPLQEGASTSLFGAASVVTVPAQGGAASTTSSNASTATAAQTSAPTVAAPTAQRVHEIDLDLATGGVANASMTVRLAGDKLGVVIRAASGETAATIEGARDAIAERLAAIGQPVSSIIIQQTDASDATGGSGQSTAEGEGREQQGRNSEAGDSRGSRHGASRF